MLFHTVVLYSYTSSVADEHFMPRIPAPATPLHDTSVHFLNVLPSDFPPPGGTIEIIDDGESDEWLVLFSAAALNVRGNCRMQAYYHTYSCIVYYCQPASSDHLAIRDKQLLLPPSVLPSVLLAVSFASLAPATEHRRAGERTDSRISPITNQLPAIVASSCLLLCARFSTFLLCLPFRAPLTYTYT